ncbi:MAG TPA: type IV pilus assembly protein PilM [Solirubrobacterales bacterium]|nr:type IV pilus assembly protein PilM [Solirubrobacterales bacterium]
MIGDLFPTLQKLRGKGSDDTLVGLEVEADSVAAVEVRKNGSVELTASAVGPLAPGAVDDGEVTDRDAVATALRSLFASNKLSRRVRLGIANQRVVVRTVRLPAIEDPKELAAAVRFTAQEQIPMPIEEAVLDHRVVGGVPAGEGGPPQLDVVVVAARTGMIDAWLETLRAADLEPVGIDLSAFGLIRALGDLPEVGDEGPAKPTTATLYCNVGDVTNLAVAQGRSCLFTRVSPAGIDDIVASLSASTGLTREHAQQWLSYVGLAQPPESLEGDPDTVARTRAALESGASALLDELRLSLDFYSAQEGALPVDGIVLSGPGSIVPGLSERLEPGLGLPIEVRQPSALSGLDPAAAARLTLSYGLALED